MLSELLAHKIPMEHTYQVQKTFFFRLLGKVLAFFFITNSGTFKRGNLSNKRFVSTQKKGTKAANNSKMEQLFLSKEVEIDKRIAINTR